MLRWKHINRVTAHTKLAAGKIGFVPCILHAHQLSDQVALPNLVSDPQSHHHLVVALGLANAVNGRHRGHNDHIAPLKNALRTAQTHLLNVFIDGAVFLDEKVALGHIGFRLVVVVVANEVLHSILGKKLPKLAVQLSGQCLVGRKNNGRAAKPCNRIGHGESLAGARHAKQCLKHLAIAHPLHQLLDRYRLVSSRWIGHKQLKRRAVKMNKLALLRRRAVHRNHGRIGKG